MRICVLVPSEENLKQAGVRIRYRRIEAPLRELGHELRVASIQEFGNPRAFVDDAYVISKCYDARAFVAARLLNRMGKPVGIDLFDDYFSQVEDSRFTRLRHWLRTLLGSVDFILCATPAMRELARGFRQAPPIHVMNDPSPAPSAEAILAATREKLERLRRSRQLRIAWFGIGDNPSFPVGLADLSSFAGILARLRGRGYDLSLDILTNGRAMTSDTMTRLRRLPLPWTIEEWTEEREAALLARTFLSFLPVNAQSFSIVKSLNRAVTALSAGNQILAAGFPLYASLAPFVYREPSRLIADVDRGKPLLRDETVPELVTLLEKWAAPDEEARKLVSFLRDCCDRVSVRPAARDTLALVVHGQNTSSDVHKLSRGLGALSVASPYCTQKFNFDVRFALSPRHRDLEIYVAEQVGARLPSRLAAHLRPHGKIVDWEFLRLDPAHVLADRSTTPSALAESGSALGVTASYPRVIGQVHNALKTMFPGAEVLLSEQSKLPWWVAPAEDRAAEIA